MPRPGRGCGHGSVSPNLPNAIPLGLTEKRNMKKVKELIQDIKKNWWIEGLEDWRIQIIQSKTHQSPNGKGGAE